MASLPIQECCNKGYRHEGTAVGRYEEWDGIETYLVGDEHKEKRILLFLTDVLGNKFINTQLKADQFAEQGFWVVMPDLFYGDAKPLNAQFSPEGWWDNHTPEITQPFVDKTVAKILSSTSSSVAIYTVGYCFGAPYVVKLLNGQQPRVKAGAIAHPAHVTAEMLEEIKKPLFIAAAEIDSLFPPEMRRLTEDILKKIGAEYFMTIASHVKHGFCTRGDFSDPRVVFANEKAFFDFVQWFNHCT